MQNMGRKLLLITGIPGTGKTTIGDFLANSYDFIHFDMEETGRASEINSDVEKFVNINFPVDQNIVLTWGFAPDEATIKTIGFLKLYGFDLFWFDGDHNVAREMCIKRGSFNESEFQEQMRLLGIFDVPSKIGAKIINVFNEDGSLKDKLIIAKEIGVK
jgi:hypothetical protein